LPEQQAMVSGPAERRPALAVRVDENSGVREEVEFFGDDTRLFGCRHLPIGPITHGLVVCSPILSDFGANYVREVRLSRRLAAAGIAVQRFHPRGSGHSDGSRLDLTFASMVADTSRAIERLQHASGVEDVAILGTRFSALVAAAAGRAISGAPIALWEPVLSPGRFFRDGLRARSVYHLKRGTAGPDDPSSELSASGYVDILGVAVGPDLFETSARHDLASELGNNPRRVLLVQLDSSPELRRPYREVVDRWTNTGLDVTAACCPTEETWWFVHDRLTPIGAVLDVTADWLLARGGADE
jgi:hypothetical protein